MKKHKVTGPDNIPIEVFKTSIEALELLCKLFTYIWKEEKVPQTLEQTFFVILFKNKGRPNNPSSIVVLVS